MPTYRRLRSWVDLRCDPSALAEVVWWSLRCATLSLRSRWVRENGTGPPTGFLGSPVCASFPSNQSINQYHLLFKHESKYNNLQLLEISTRKYQITKRNSQADWRTVSEPSRENNWWLEWKRITQINDTHFRWKIKWRLEYLGALGSMGERLTFSNLLWCFFWSRSWSNTRLNVFSCWSFSLRRSSHITFSFPTLSVNCHMACSCFLRRSLWSSISARCSWMTWYASRKCSSVFCCVCLVMLLFVPCQGREKVRYEEGQEQRNVEKKKERDIISDIIL